MVLFALSARVCVCVFVCLSVSLSVCPAAGHLEGHNLQGEENHGFICALCARVCVCVCVSVCLSLCLC